MLVRKILRFFIFAVVLNVAIHIYYIIYPLYPKENVPKKYMSKQRRSAVVTMDLKILFNKIACNQTNANTKFSEMQIMDSKENSMSPKHTSNTTVKYSTSQKTDISRFCPHVPPGLGPVEKDKAIMELHGIDDMYLRIEPGGLHMPSECVPEQQIAIVVAIHETDNRTRSQIGSFIYYMHPFLMKQLSEYQIFVVLKKNSSGVFERGKLFNIGYIEAQTYRNEGWDCFIFHDPHLIPLDTRNLYKCSKRPKMLIADFRKPYRFGGAVAINPQDFADVNGFSNLIWPNDGDYIDMYRRLISANFSIEGNLSPIGNYTTINFLLQRNTKTDHIRNRNSTSEDLKDGLSSLYYNIDQLDLRQFYTLIEVEDDDDDDLNSQEVDLRDVEKLHKV